MIDTLLAFCHVYAGLEKVILHTRRTEESCEIRRSAESLSDDVLSPDCCGFRGGRVTGGSGDVHQPFPGIRGG